MRLGYKPREGAAPPAPQHCFSVMLVPNLGSWKKSLLG